MNTASKQYIQAICRKYCARLYISNIYGLLAVCSAACWPYLTVRCVSLPDTVAAQVARGDLNRVADTDHTLPRVDAVCVALAGQWDMRRLVNPGQGLINVLVPCHPAADSSSITEPTSQDATRQESFNNSSLSDDAIDDETTRSRRERDGMQWIRAAFVRKLASVYCGILLALCISCVCFTISFLLFCCRGWYFDEQYTHHHRDTSITEYSHRTL